MFTLGSLIVVVTFAASEGGPRTIGPHRQPAIFGSNPPPPQDDPGQLPDCNGVSLPLQTCEQSVNGVSCGSVYKHEQANPGGYNDRRYDPGSASGCTNLAACRRVTHEVEKGVAPSGCSKTKVP
jgi:hypothetical protein